MDILTLLSFLSAAVLLTLAPGPDNMFVLAQSISKGKNAGILTSAGLCTGLIVHILAATFGISAIIYQSSIAFAVVKYAGAAYLLYLAYKAFREKDSSFAQNKLDASNHESLYKKGIIMNLLNPKVSLFFPAFLPQFVNDQAGNVSLQMLAYGIVFLVQSLVIFTFISIFAGKLGNFMHKSPAISRKINILQGSIFALIGLKIAFTPKN
ncbi:LysE family translocator [Paenibacillus sp. DMB20]|uniref:LysE family translocator n=1 Tax=Paenibacillus sp. DMB20 TaxID=1642570 RepID=UPI0006279AD7|nr:LysE family translocator [Paenibacillus sp. DMB20]KKO50806.1 threonine transporter RhtB [Paenibacillus sp. DMB20]